MKALSFDGHGYNHSISREKGLRDNQTKVSNGGEREKKKKKKKTVLKN